MTAPDKGAAAPGSGNPLSALQTAASLLTELVDHFDSRSKAAAPYNLIITYVTNAYLARLTPETAPQPRMLEQELLAAGNAVIRSENGKIPKGDGPYPLSRQLSYWQVAQILLRLHNVVRIAPSTQNTDREYDLLAMYRDAGPRRGTYTNSEDEIRTATRMYNTQLSTNDFKEVVAILREDSPRVNKCDHPDIVAFANGLAYYGKDPLDVTIGGKDFHFEPKQIHPFDPAIVFTTKPGVNYDYNGGNLAPVVIQNPDGTDWEIVEWVNNLSDDEGIPDLLWEILGALLRPNVSWNKTAWFFSERGNNGKGTLCRLGRNLLGSGAHTSIPLADFGKNFALEPLISSNAIIVDENDVGTFIDQAANLKAVVTGDVIQIDRKHRTPIAYQFRGFMIQCLNDYPRAKDKSDSFYRRQLFVPFNKWFGGGDEKEYIKDDYLQRQEVLEYAVWYLFNKAGAGNPGDYYRLSEPPATKAVLAEYMETNDPVRAFWEEFRLRFVWDLLPIDFLYVLHKAWFVLNSPSGSMISKQKFAQDLRGIVRDDPLWFSAAKDQKVRPSNRMAAAEPLIAEYELKQFYAPGYKGTDVNRLCHPMLQPNYRAPILRASAFVGTNPADDLGDELSDVSDVEELVS